MNDNVRIILAIALVLIALFGEKAAQLVNDNVEIVDDVISLVDEPSMENKELVKPITEINIESKDAELISLFYLELSDVINKDDSIIEYTEQFRNLNTFAGVLHFNTSLRDKYENLGEKIDSAIANAIGKQNVAMNQEKRKDLIDVLNAVAWSVTQ
tara:strand:+ start:4957 stop:5424 length:468 start_codon:yes stop_codon:yes gene_type:complete